MIDPTYFNFYNAEYTPEILKPRIIEYFMENIQCCQFTVPEIKSGIRKLKNKIEFYHTHHLHSNETK